MILWKRLDRPGHEAARLIHRGEDWLLAGTAVFSHENEPVRLDYSIVCDRRWRTMSACVEGWMGGHEVEMRIDSYNGIWRMNGAEAAVVQGCVDVDLNFSPSTNLLPIRRLDLRVGESAPVRAAWLRFPTFSLEPLEQVYTRVGENRWRYESAGGSFAAELDVDGDGFVREYAGAWKAE